MAADFGKTVVLALVQGAIIGGGLYGLAKLSQWMTKRKKEKWIAENRHLPEPALQTASDKRELASNNRDFIVWLVVIAVVGLGFWLLMSFPRKFVFQEMGYNAPANWKENRS